MKKEMQVDSDSDKEDDALPGEFVFSRPNVIPSPEKMGNFGTNSQSTPGSETSQMPEVSAFTFAKPTSIDAIDFMHQDTPAQRNELMMKKDQSDSILSQESVTLKGYIDEEPPFPVKKTIIARNHDLMSNQENDQEELNKGKSSPKKVEKVTPKLLLDTDEIIELSDSNDEVTTPPKTKSTKSKKSKSPSTAQDLKKSSAFTQLEKNRKKSDVKLELDKSISCIDVPDTLLVKAVAKEYFDQYGETLKVTVRPKRKMITVYYSTKDDATNAYKKARSFLGHNFTVEWTTQDILNKPKKRESIKGKIASILNFDDEVREELEAMRGLEYNLPDPQNLRALTAAAKAKVKRAAKVVANKEAPKVFQKAPVKLIKPLIATEKLPSKPVDVTITKPIIPEISPAMLKELQKQKCQAGTTSEEKWKILDARDKLMRLKQIKQKNLATATLKVGTCLDMCPEKERYMREFQRQLSPYEQMEGSEYKINHLVAVKQYSRSSADQEEPMAHDLRPLKSLKMTMSYLLHEIADVCEDDDANLTEWYHFLWDRTRSIRKDITQQELCCKETVELVEQCARFHILSSERLCAEEVSVFDPKINSENLTKCLQSLKYMYNDLREQGISCQNEPEFRAYIVLLNLNNGSFISELSALPRSVQHSPEVKFSLNVYSAIAMDNYSRFFKLVRKTTYLNGCILLRYFNQVRVKALAVMVKAYCRASGNTEYPLYELIDILGFEDEDEVFDFCSRIGLKCDRESLYIKLNKETFHAPQGNLEQGRAYNLVLAKRHSSKNSVGECIAGGSLPPKTYENHKPYSSFNAQGFLLDSVTGSQDQTLTPDPYTFVDDEVPTAPAAPLKKPANVFSVNNVAKRKPSDFVFTKPPSTVFQQKAKPAQFASGGKGLPVQASVASSSFSSSSTTTSSIITGNSTLKTIDQKLFAPPSTTSIFATTPSSPRFSAMPKASLALPTTSPINTLVTNSIFSGANKQTNLFKVPQTPTSASNKFPVPAFGSGTSLSTTQTGTSVSGSSGGPVPGSKRRLDDSDAESNASSGGDSASSEKRSNLSEMAEKLKKCQKEAAERLAAEREKLATIERVATAAQSEFSVLLDEIVKELCGQVAKEELHRAALIDKLSQSIYEGLFRDICATDLRELLDEQLFVQDMLIEVDRRLRDRLGLKYGKAWKVEARRRAQCREALDNTPVWLQPESLQECAKKLFRPEQRIAIGYARELKRRSRELTDAKQQEHRKPKHTPIQYVVHVGLSENARSFDALVETGAGQHGFWKMAISWPLLDDRITLWRHRKLISKYLSPEDPNLEPIVIRHRPSPWECLNICIRHFEGLVCDEWLTGTDGLLFVVASDEDNRSIERRLTRCVLSREKLMPLPLVVLVFGDDQAEPSASRVVPVVESLLETGFVSEYTLLLESRVDEDVVLKVLQSATLWLAINRSPAVPLLMDYLRNVFDDCLTEQLWLRIQGYLAHNSKYSRALKDPNFIIKLHNEAVNHIIDIILDPESMSYTDFAPEFKVYLDSKRTYPCMYEHFDSVWKHPEYRAELERIMSSFILPPWREDWPIYDMEELYDSIFSYCHKLLSYEQSVCVTNNVISDLFLVSSPENDNCPCFADVVIHIVNKKISDIGSNTRVVFNKNHIKHFQTLPWWFKSKVLADHAVEPNEEDSEMTSMVQITESTSQLQLEFDCDIDELNETCRQLDEDSSIDDFCREARNKISDVQRMAKKLDQQLELQKLRNMELETKLREALGDEAS
ncbi:hypothetical protein QAD02_014707 [Eretmocerus hayati]|uniref:Uncharacterized protein n=1 Tax=Eretmocerus hayati TaxID=131215 RepID=A0ACC2P692_9HYME|nr:hypothetical protein QAD02_014707 [Eretmocerus hayati]